MNQQFKSPLIPLFSAEGICHGHGYATCGKRGTTCKLIYKVVTWIAYSKRVIVNISFLSHSLQYFRPSLRISFQYPEVKLPY